MNFSLTIDGNSLMQQRERKQNVKSGRGSQNTGNNSLPIKLSKANWKDPHSRERRSGPVVTLPTLKSKEKIRQNISVTSKTSAPVNAQSRAGSVGEAVCAKSSVSRQNCIAKPLVSKPGNEKKRHPELTSGRTVHRPLVRGERRRTMDDNRYGSDIYSSTSRRVGQRVPEDDHELQESGAGGASLQNSALHHQDAGPIRSGGYTVISPNEKRRQQLTSQANKELQEYEARRAARKPSTIHGPAQSTGGEKSEREARLAVEKASRDKKYEQIRKRQQWQREKREREDKKLEEKKARAREQTRRNQQLRAEREERFLRSDHARTNEGFLSRLEATQCQSRGDDTSHVSPELQSLIEMFPHKDSRKLRDLLTHYGNDVNQVINLLTD